MEAHKFTIGDQVRLLLDNYANDIPADIYTITRALPAMANVWQYRVKKITDGQERAVSEQQLVKTVCQTWTDLSAAAAQHDTKRVRNDRASVRAQVVSRRSEEEKR